MNILIETTNGFDYPLSLTDVKIRFPDVSFPDFNNLSLEDIKNRLFSFNCFVVEDIEQPQHDQLTEYVEENLPVKVNNEWIKTFSVKTYQDAEARVQSLIGGKVYQLWAAADAYERNYISGVAVGILTIGVLQGLPKALAVKAWSKSIWNAYFERKALVTLTSIDNHDFSFVGPMPHSVSELQAELGM